MFFKWFQLLILTSHAVLIVYLLYSISLQLVSITNSQDFLVEMQDLYMNMEE
jgi:hypothetical protein